MAVVRRLDGISYWVIENPTEIADYVTVNLRREWEADLRTEGKDPDGNDWLRTLAKRTWSLNIAEVSGIKLNQELMNYVDRRTGYDFAKRLQERQNQLKEEIEISGRVIPPVILRAEDNQLMDGYCRHSTLKEMGITSVYAYVGSLSGSSSGV